MDTVYKILENCEVKKVGERQYEFIASTADQDRDGEVIDVTGWDLKNFKKNPVIMFAHDYRTLPIGRATKIGVREGKLVNNVEFPPEGTYEFADIVERLVGAGFLKTESVGFMPKKWEDGDGGEKSPRRTYTKQELLEISIVPVPSNPNALMNAVEEGIITTKQFEQITKAEYNCECIECGHKLKSEKHCQDIKCPECGGEMRRAERPGPGKEADDIVTKPEETDDFIRIPVRACEVTATIDISKKEGIQALYCGKEKQVATYLFRKDHDWTMAKAKKWVKDHEKKIAHDISQAEIIDEIDYLTNLINTEGLNEEAKKAAEALVLEIRRVSGYDNPVDIEKLMWVGIAPKDTTKKSLDLLSEIIKEQMEVK